ncbi:hypothetical protein NJI34_37960 [Pseudomonas sp. S 311-6]|nr:hypothetical protein CBF45_12630 [Bordetella sp. J329]MCO7642561.1 hypothetical protein [Pseudomonas sp. S 311-6]
MYPQIEQALEARFSNIYGGPASVLVRDCVDQDNRFDGVKVLVRFFVSTTPDMHINPYGPWYEIVFNVEAKHAVGLLSDDPDKISFEIDTLMACAKAHREELWENMDKKITPPYRVDGPHQK